jgi:hypothetical protein
MSYDDSGKYCEPEGNKLIFKSEGTDSKYSLFSIDTRTSAEYTDKEFKKKMKVRIYWTGGTGATDTNPKVYYLSGLEFFRYIKNKENQMMIPFTCGGTADLGEVQKEYRLFSAN